MSTSLRLNSGYDIPTVGLGTWQLKAEEAEETFTSSIKFGYRLFDCAHVYDNEVAIGRALKRAIEDLKLVKREELFITSKLWCTSHKKEEVKRALINTLTDLQLDYLDLYLIHWPLCFKTGPDPFPTGPDGVLLYEDIPHLETWQAMEECVREGLVRSIGLSNFNITQIKNILQHSEIKPSVLQIEVYPYLQNQRLVDFCSQNGIKVMAYGSLGSINRTWDLDKKDKSVLDDQVIKKLALKHRKTPAQVILRWLIQNNITVIAKSSNPERIKENIQIFDFKLSAEDLSGIDSLEKGLRNFGKNICINGCYLLHSEDIPHYPFGEY